MKSAFFALIIFALVANFAVAEEDSESANLSKEDIEIIQNLEILQELDMLKDIELLEDYETIKDMEPIELKGETDEKRLD